MRRAANRILNGLLVLAATLAIGSSLGLARGAKPEPSVTQQKGAAPESTADAGDSGKPDAATSTSTATSQPVTGADTGTSFEDWRLQCLPTREAETPCQVTHRLMSPNKKQVVLVVSVGPSKKKISRIQMALPLGFSIQHGVKIAFGSSYATTVPISRCTLQGCLVEGIAPLEMISAMENEKSGMVSVWTIDDRVVQLPLSLNGFKSAYEADVHRLSRNP